jgi:Sulfotransferase family
MLHRLALGSRAIAEMSFDMEKATQRPDGDAAAQGQHVFVAGLARAGTTVLMRRFHASHTFATLTYRDMPFVLAPGLWAKLSRRSRRDIAAAERAHGDGVIVDADSPESLDEVFWRIFCGSDYLRDDALVPHDADADTITDLRRYIGAIMQHAPGQPGRYLSKTNNSILRLPTLRRAFPNALFLVPFREPLQHANSLMKQHVLFSQEQRDDAFVLQYMTWLGHHEFGLGHRPFVFDGQRPTGDPGTLAYWVDLWCNVYSALLARHKGEVTFVSYDRLCTDAGVWKDLAERAQIAPDSPDADRLRHVTHEVANDVQPDLLARAKTIHAHLLES